MPGFRSRRVNGLASQWTPSGFISSTPPPASQSARKAGGRWVGTHGCALERLPAQPPRTQRARAHAAFAWRRCRCNLELERSRDEGVAGVVDGKDVRARLPEVAQCGHDARAELRPGA